MTQKTPAQGAETKTAPAAKAPVTGKTIKLLVTANPKKPGSASAKRYGLYKDGMTVEAYKQAVKDAGQPARLAGDDPRWDLRHEFIKLV